MGITQLSFNRLTKHNALSGNMLELGCQNVYFDVYFKKANERIAKPFTGSVAKDMFVGIGINHTSWDICGCQGSEPVDLRDPVHPIGFLYDVITDFGTTEHIDGNLWQAFKNIHNHCKVGGLMIHENPKTGNWPGHGCNYYTQDFYIKLAEYANYEILELTEEPAMGNIIDGWNVCCVLRKLSDSPFISKEQFETLDYRTS